jgi:hypothetical protein
LVHFNPITSKPIYINAEYLIDPNKIKAVGDFLGKDVLITQPTLLDQLKKDIEPLMEWKSMAHGFYPCGACKASTCKPVDKYIIDEVG